MINPLQLIQMLKGGNPKQMILNAIKQQSGKNPVVDNILNMAENQDAKGLEKIARNLCESNGINADDMVNQIKSQMGIK